MHLTGLITTSKARLSLFRSGRPVAVRCDIVYDPKKKTKLKTLYNVHKEGFLTAIGKKLEKGLKLNAINKKKASITIEFDNAIDNTLRELSYEHKIAFVCNALENVDYLKDLRRAGAIIIIAENVSGIILSQCPNGYIKETLYVFLKVG